MKQSPWERIAVYSRPTPSGGTSVDTEAMVVDLITIFKAGGYQLQDLLTFIQETWSEVHVEISIPPSKKS